MSCNCFGDKCEKHSIERFEHLESKLKEYKRTNENHKNNIAQLQKLVDLAIPYIKNADDYELAIENGTNTEKWIKKVKGVSANGESS